MTYQYGLGSTYLGVATFASMGVIWPRGDFQPYVDTKELGDGSIVSVGSPRETFHWDFITKAQWDIIHAFRSATSTPIHVRTKNELDAWHTYSGLMFWPGPQEWVVTRGLKFSIEFRSLVAED